MKHISWILMAILCLPGATLGQKKKDEKELITKDTQKAIDASLAWLAKQQNKDGSFGTGQYHGNLGVTSLAGLAFLSRSRDPVNKDFDKTVEDAVRYVLSNEDKQRPGFLNNQRAAFHGPMYGHGFAVLFLADAHEMIGDKKLKAEIKATLERAVKLLIDAQNKDGGWRYQPLPVDADLSVTAVQVVALRAARDLGIGVPQKTFDKAIEYVKRCQHKDDGGFRYQAVALGGSGFARTAAGLTALNRLGVKEGEAIDKGAKYLRKFDLANPPPEMTIHYSYGHYYAAKAMWHAGANVWQNWYPKMRAELLEARKDDHWTRSSGISCPHYNTAVALIILQMPHNQLPSMKR